MEGARRAGLADTLRDALRPGARRPLGEAIPYLGLLGIDLDAVEDGLILRMKYVPSLLGAGALHGGTVSALLESTAACELLLRSEPDARPMLVSFTVEYLRTGKPLDTFAAATVARQGRRVASVQVQAWQEDRSLPIATAQASFTLQQGGG